MQRTALDHGKFRRCDCKLCSLALATTLLLIGSIALNAQFAFVDDGVSATLIGYFGPGGDVTIPGTAKGLPVTSIADNVFQGLTTLTNITIPTSVASIGSHAFDGCSRMTNASVLGNLKTIGSYAFGSCVRLTAAPIPGSVTNIGDHAFYVCSKITRVTIPGGVKKIEDSTFSSCSLLTNVTVSSGVTNIGNSAFGGCPALTIVSLPATLTEIGFNAFDFCSALTTLSLPGSLLTIRDAAFRNTGLTNLFIPASVQTIGLFYSSTNLTSIQVDGASPYFSSIGGVLFDKNQTVLHTFPSGKSPGAYTIPASITNIQTLAFYSCPGVTNIIIPEGVLGVTAEAFLNCQGLTAILVDPLNPNYSSLNGVLFDKTQTTLLQFPTGNTANSYNVPGSVTSIGLGAFAYAMNLTSIAIPGSVTVIGTQAFYFCSALRSVVIPSGVRKIPDTAFSYCTGLTNMTIPGSVTNIGIQSFLNCSGMSGFFFAGNAPTLGSDAFLNDTHATIYRLPATTGWSSTFGTRPVVLWNPAFPVDSSLGFESNGFALTINGTANIPIVLEACTNLANRTWVPLFSGILSNGSLAFTDSDATNFPRRFYRVRSP